MALHKTDIDVVMTKKSLTNTTTNKQKNLKTKSEVKNKNCKVLLYWFIATDIVYYYISL